MKPGKTLCCLLVFIILSPACASAPATDALPTQTVSVTDLPTFVYIVPPTVPTATPFSAVPTISFLSTPPIDQLPTYTPTKLLPTNTPVPTRTLVPLPFERLEGLRAVYSIDGNLYVQDSGEQIVQITHSNQDSGPMFSDDGQKIVFYRGKNQLWSINADGTGEQELIDLDGWSVFGQEYDERTELRSLVLVPGTHQFLFNTHFYRKTRNEPPKLNNDLFLVDTDTAETRQLLALGQGGNFLASPDGKQIAVQMPDHIDVFDIQGQIIRQNLVTYPADNAHAEVPMFWMPDSKELIVLPSDIDPLTAGIPVLRQVWRYSLDGNSGIEIKLDPPPWNDAFSISPDGNWIAYSYESSELDPDGKAGVYLGDLRNGTSQLIFPPPLMASGFLGTVPLNYNAWSPDSVYFSCHYDELYVGNIRGDFTSLGLLRRQEEIPAWIDGNHYLVDNGSVLVEVGKQKKVRVVGLPPGVNQPNDIIFLGNGITP